MLIWQLWLVASHPDILQRAGLADAELIVAVTDPDEINMVACQVAHTIFETPNRIGVRGCAPMPIFFASCENALFAG